MISHVKSKNVGLVEAGRRKVVIGGWGGRGEMVERLPRGQGLWQT